MMDEPYTPPGANLDPDKADAKKVPNGIRFLSLCMIVGSVVSLVTIAALSNKLISRPLLAMVFLPFIALFIVYIWKAIGLWQGKAGSYSWALWLFLIQVPIISVHGFNYHLYTGLLAAYQFGDVATNLVLRLGGEFSFYISPAIKAQYFGINLFALFACFYLFRVLRGNNAKARADA